MGIGVPRHFDPGMSETAGYFLNIDPCICQKGGVRVPEVVDADFFDPSHIGKLFVVQLDCGIPQGTDAAAYLICFCKSGNRFPSCLVLVQNSQKGSGDLQRPNRAFVFRRGFPVVSLELLGDAPLDGQIGPINIPPFQAVNFAFSQSCIESNGKEYIVIPFA